MEILETEKKKMLKEVQQAKVNLKDYGEKLEDRDE